MPIQTKMPIVLSFAGSDATCGAGAQADLLTLSSMGCHPLTVITAITVQDTARVEDFFAIDSEWVSDQARAVLEDIPVAAFKIGMVGSVENIAAIADILSDYPDIPVILDPILSSGAGDPLTAENMLEAMREMLLPLTTILTPNSIEARRLATDDENANLSLDDCATLLIQQGAKFVLITGTHENTPQVNNMLYGNVSGVASKIRMDHWARLSASYHGSGCTLSSAIAACIALGMTVPEAVQEAQEFTWHSLNAGYRIGMGQPIPDRLFWVREENQSNPENKPQV